MEILVDQGATEVISTFRVTSPLGTAPGIYNIDLTLTNNTGSAGPVSTIANVVYEVLPSPDTTPPPAPTGLFGTTFPGNPDDYIVLQWTEPPDVSDIVVYQPYRNGVALPTPATTQPIYVDFFFSALESNAYIVRSVDAAGNESLPSNSIVAGVPDVEAPTTPANLMGSLDAGEISLS